MSPEPDVPIGIFISVLPLPLGWQLLANANGQPLLLAPHCGFPPVTPAMLQQFRDAILGWATCPCTVTLRERGDPRMLAAELAVKRLRAAGCAALPPVHP